MEAICQACGDRGWQENLICCSKCSDAYEHRYCLEDASKIFQLHVKWTCPDCLPSPKKRPWIRKMVDASLSPRRSKRQYKKSERQTNVSNEISPEKGSSARKIIPEAVTPRMKNSNGSSTVDFVEPPLVVDFSDHGLLNDNISVIVEKKDPPSLDDNVGKGSAFSQKVVPVSDHFVSDAFAKGGSPLNNNCYIPAQPVEDPIWKGCFSISSKDFESVDGMAAHLSSKACFKVRNEASLLPVNISSDILPKADVWPKSFQQAKPSDDSIGLYFFPETERDEKIYNSLIENMMINDLALRCVVANAELLVFTSIELPFGCWRFQGKHYLWGVFRGKSASCPSSVAS